MASSDLKVSSERCRVIVAEVIGASSAEDPRFRHSSDDEDAGSSGGSLPDGPVDAALTAPKSGEHGGAAVVAENYPKGDLHLEYGLRDPTGRPPPSPFALSALDRTYAASAGTDGAGPSLRGVEGNPGQDDLRGTPLYPVAACDDEGAGRGEGLSRNDGSNGGCGLFSPLSMTATANGSDGRSSDDYVRGGTRFHSLISDALRRIAGNYGRAGGDGAGGDGTEEGDRRGCGDQDGGRV